MPPRRGVPTTLRSLRLVLLLLLIGACSPAEPAPENLVEAPPAGETIATFLADGRPIFVVAHEDGQLSVLDGISTHKPWGIGKLLAWCSSGRRFLDMQHGSSFDEWGLRVGGPAPTGLEGFSFVLVTTPDGPRAKVQGSIGPTPGQPPGDPQPAQSCFDESERLVVHTFAGTDPLSPGQALAAGGSSWLLIEGILDAANARMCADDRCDETAPVHGLDLRSAVRPSTDLRWYLARVGDGALVDLLAVLRLT